MVGTVKAMKDKAAAHIDMYSQCTFQEINISPYAGVAPEIMSPLHFEGGNISASIYIYLLL